VPCFLPIATDVGGSKFLFHGVFCSWNCVKAFAINKAASQGHSKPKGFEYIPLFAFLLAYRPRYCPADPFQPHPVSCPCLERIFRVDPAAPKERLTMFGGPVSIERYREGFLTIEDVKWTWRYFHQNTYIPSNMKSLTAELKQRRWTFTLLHDEFMAVEEKKEVEKAMTSGPIVNMKKKPSLF
jgi:hypothetical protein